MAIRFQGSDLEILRGMLSRLEQGFEQYPDFEAESLDPQSANLLGVVAERMRDNYPYPHPLYLGQMLKPPHPLARAAYALAMHINPNNHAHDGGRTSSEMEKECIREFGRMVGWETPLGHLCSGGTIANFEALWVARELNPNTTVLASAMAHYTHERLSGVLQMPFRSIPVDEHGRMNATALEVALRESTAPATVVATLGTTGMGAIDPLPEILRLREEYNFRLHLDAAYGGYFFLVDELSSDAQDALHLLSAADSLVIDPHKHGLQPYGCGCVLFRDPQVAAIYKHDSPYTYFTSEDLHLGEISLECSRAGAAAVALWATLQRFPLVTGGEFAQRLLKSHRAALGLYEWLLKSSRFMPLVKPELDVVVWVCRAETSHQASDSAKKLFKNAAAEQDLHLALIQIDHELIEPLGAIQVLDEAPVTCLRACLMKPGHLDWLPEIIRRLEAAC